MSDHKAIVVVPFVRMPASQNPNLKASGADDPASPYYRSMFVSFASVKRFNPKVGMALVTNELPPEPYISLLVDLGVEIREIPFGHQPPDGFTKTFAGSLFLLDALEYPEETTRVIIDPDVLCIRPIDSMMERVSGAIGALEIDLDPDESINGISRRQAGHLHELLGEKPSTPVHYGGEVYVIPPGELGAIKSRCDEAWGQSLERHVQGLTKFSTEEHILSYALRNADVHELSKYTRRIWTAHRHRNVRGDENSLTLWHLPAEKDRGFAQLYTYASDRSSWFWSAPEEEFIAKAGRAMGLHHRSVVRLAKDTIAPLVQRLRRN